MEINLNDGDVGDDFILIYPGAASNHYIRPAASVEFDSISENYDSDEESHYRELIEKLEKQISESQSRIEELTNDNNVLRRQRSMDQPLEEKVKSLKRRNGELVVIARQLEDRVKRLQEESKKTTKTDSVTVSKSDELRRLFYRQRAQDLAEYTKNILMRDKEIELLRVRYDDCMRQMKTGDNIEQDRTRPEKDELTKLLKQCAKEKLLLESQLSSHKPRGDYISFKESPDVCEARNRIAQLEGQNDSLKRDVQLLNQSVRERSNDSEVLLLEKNQQCSSLTTEIENLRNKLEVEIVEKHQLENILKDFEERNGRLTIQIEQSEQNLKQLHTLKEECTSLQSCLKDSQNLCQQYEREQKSLLDRVLKAETLCKDYQDSTVRLRSEIRDLESAIKNFEANAENQSDIRRENQQLAQKLNAKENEIIMIEKIQNDLKTSKDVELEETRKRLLLLSEELQTLRQNQERKSQDSNSLISKSVQTDSIDLRGITQGSDIKRDSSKEIISRLTYYPKHVQHIESDIGEHVTNTPMATHNHIRSLPREMGTGYETNEKSGPQVYRARYNYDPVQYSPNDNPEAELPLIAGDYIIVFGHMDEMPVTDGVQ